MWALDGDPRIDRLQECGQRCVEAASHVTRRSVAVVHRDPAVRVAGTDAHDGDGTVEDPTGDRVTRLVPGCADAGCRVPRRPRRGWMRSVGPEGAVHGDTPEPVGDWAGEAGRPVCGG